MQKSKHILVIRMSAMGDVAMTVPVVETLLNQNPNVKVTLLSKAFLQPLFEGMERVEFYAADVKGKHKGVLGLYKLYRELKSKNIDAVADLHHVLRSRILRFLFKLNGASIQYIDKGRLEKKALTALKNKVFQPLKTTHQRYADVFEKLGFKIDLFKPSLRTKVELTDELLGLLQVSSLNKLIGIAPFAAHEGKKYPLNLMKEVIQELSSTNKVLLFGGGVVETEKLKELEDRFENVTSLAGKLKLKQELEVISNLDLMISMDSGNGHFAALYGVSTISIWGATHPYAGFVPFRQEQNCLVADRAQYPLLPTSVYGNKIVEGYEQVMETILPETIVQKALNVLQGDC